MQTVLYCSLGVLQIDLQVYKSRKTFVLRITAIIITPTGGARALILVISRFDSREVERRRNDTQCYFRSSHRIKNCRKF